MLITAIIVVDILAALFLVIFILLHSGRGAGLSDLFGGTSSLSGGTALERRLDKITVATAIIFAVCTIYLSAQWY